MSGDATGSSSEGVPSRTPLFEAQHADRYSRQELIRAYQDRFDCRLVVLIDQLMPYSIPLFEETLFDADSNRDLHVLLWTLGGDGETALRLARQAQARCRELSVIVPDVAKSAGTLFALGAHQILMGPTSDLGPIDPQFQGSDGRLVAAKTIIAAVEHALDQVARASRDPRCCTPRCSQMSIGRSRGCRKPLKRSRTRQTLWCVRRWLRMQPGREDAEVEVIAQELTVTAAHRRTAEPPRDHLGADARAVVDARDPCGSVRRPMEDGVAPLGGVLRDPVRHVSTRVRSLRTCSTAGRRGSAASAPPELFDGVARRIPGR